MLSLCTLAQMPLTSFSVCYQALATICSQVADMLPETYTLMCEDYKAAFARLLAEPRNDSDPAFVHQVVRTSQPCLLGLQAKYIDMQLTLSRHARFLCTCAITCTP